MRRLIDAIDAHNARELNEKKLVEILAEYVNSGELREYLRGLLDLDAQNIGGYEHQLGFFKFIVAELNGKYPRRVRLHFWRRGAIAKDIHDHIASFGSRIMYGTLLNTTFAFNDFGQEVYRQEFVASGGGCLPNTQFGKVKRLSQTGQFSINQDDIYYVNFDELHCAEPVSDNVISLVIQDAPVNRNINVFRENAPQVDFSYSPRVLPDFEQRKLFEEMHFLLGGVGC